MKYLGILMFLFSTFGSPKRRFVACSLCRDRDDLIFFDFVFKLLECGVAKGHAIRQFFSTLPLLKLIEPVSFSLRLLLDLFFIYPPLPLHFNI